MDSETVLARLRESHGLTLVDPVALSDGRARVLRCRVTSGADHPSLIVKIADPDSVTFRRELAAYRVLPDWWSGRSRIPRLVAALPEYGVLVLEDITRATPLLRLLLGSDRAGTQLSLGRTSHALGELHAKGRSVRDRWPLQLGAGPPAFQEQAATFERAFPAIHQLIAALGIRPTDAFDDGLEHLSRRIAEGAPETTITVGDIAPTNVFLSADEVVFIDFEYAGVRHPFYDAMFWHCICSFPPDVCDAMTNRYRVGLAEGGWPFDDDRFDRGMVDAASHRLFWTLGWTSTANLLEKDRPAPPTRALLLHYIAEFVRLARGRPHDPALVAMAEECLRRLLLRWDERPAEAAFPVFSGSSGGQAKR